MKKDKQILMMCNSGDDSVFHKVIKGRKVMIGSGEHAVFVRAGEQDELDKKSDKLYKKIDCELKIKQVKDFLNLSKRIESFKIKGALVAIRQIIIDEMHKNYYQDITNISEVVDIDTHLMRRFVDGIDYMHVENLVIWQNGFYNFNCFNFPIPGSLKNKDCYHTSIVSKKLAYSDKCK